MLSFRKKILLSDLLVFILFLAVLFPIVDLAVKRAVRTTLNSQVERLISLLKTAPDETEMIEMMQTDKAFINQPIGLYDAEGSLLYLSHSKVVETRQTLQEIEDAIKRGRGYVEVPSSIEYEKYACIAIAFEFHGKRYILHMDILFYEIEKAVVQYEIIFTVVIGFIWAIYVMITQTVFYRFTRPIGEIINAIVPYREGKERYPPRIPLEKIKDEEFNQLAFTLNSLTEQIHKQIENLVGQRKETEEILESLGEGVVAADKIGRIIFINESACKMLGISRQDILKRSLTLIENSELAEKCHELILALLQKPENRVETIVLRKNIPIYLDLVAAPLAHENGVLLVLQDKTSEYKIVEMGKDFIANASHELRTPITIIRGFAETLQDLPDLSQEMLREITDKIVHTCIRLDKLVKSLLTLTDIENLTDERMQDTDLVMLAENCQRTIVTAHPNVSIAFKTDLKEAFIHAESDLIELAILNLLENAVKYSQPPAHVEMRLDRVDQELHLKIADKGIGIPPADLPHIFERFYTVNKARSRKLGGAGLGLSIVKTIIEKHRGRIAVSSELGKGSTFTLIFGIAGK